MPKNKEIKRALDEVLNFFEAMGQDVKLAIVDSDYLKEYFYSAVMNNYQLARKYIEYTEYKLGSRATWCNFVYLAQTWEKENVPPVIPRVCFRPLVLRKLWITAPTEIVAKTLTGFPGDDPAYSLGCPGRP